MSHESRDPIAPGPWESDSVAKRPQVMALVGNAPDDSSSPYTVCTDPGSLSESLVSLFGLEVVSVHPSCVTLSYFIGGESELRVFHWSVNTVSNTAVAGGPEVVHPLHSYELGSVHATGKVALRARRCESKLDVGVCLESMLLSTYLGNLVFGHFCDFIAQPTLSLRGRGG